MRILSFIISISIAIHVIHAASLAAAARNNHQQQAVDIHPVSYGGLKKRSSLVKRDYATTLQYLRAAMASYRKDAVTPPSAEFVQLEQSLPPSPPPATDATPPPPPPPAAAVDPVWAVATEPMPTPPSQQVISPPEAPEQADPPQHVDAVEPPLPDWSAPSSPTPGSPAPEEEEPPVVPEPPKEEEVPAATPELGNESTEKTIPIHADIEEDDAFDPEEDPDDVDDPPIVNGVAVDREE